MWWDINQHKEVKARPEIRLKQRFQVVASCLWETRDKENRDSLLPGATRREIIAPGVWFVLNMQDWTRCLKNPGETKQRQFKQILHFWVVWEAALNAVVVGCIWTAGKKIRRKDLLSRYNKLPSWAPAWSSAHLLWISFGNILSCWVFIAPWQIIRNGSFDVDLWSCLSWSSKKPLTLSMPGIHTSAYIWIYIYTHIWHISFKGCGSQTSKFHCRKNHCQTFLFSMSLKQQWFCFK